MSEQEKKVLQLCRYWYQTASDISRQTLWYEIGVMLENENAAQHRVQPTCACCGAKIVNQIEPNLPAVCSKCGGTCG